MGLRQAEQAQLVEVVVAPPLMIGPAGPAPPPNAFAQDRTESSADVAVHRRERGAMTVLEVPVPAAQRLVEPRDGAGQ